MNSCYNDKFCHEKWAARAAPAALLLTALSIADGFCSDNLLKQVLDQVSPKPTEVIRATALRYPQKNRSNEFLPRTYISMFHSSAFTIASFPDRVGIKCWGGG